MKNYLVNLLLFLLYLGLITQNVFSQAKTDSISLLPEKERSALYLEKAKSYLRSDFDLADNYLIKALSIAEKTKQKDNEGLAVKYLGITQYFRRNFDSARIYYNRALIVFNQTNNIKEQSNIINNIALLYTENGDYKSSIKYNMQALKLREEINDNKGLLISYNNIGNLYTYTGEYEKAMEYYNTALTLEQKYFPEKKKTTLLRSIAQCYDYMGNVSKALEVYVAADSMAVTSGSVMDIVSSKVSYGLFLFKTGVTEKAINVLSAALDSANNHDMHYYQSILKLNIGNIYYQSKQYDNAAEFYKAALPYYHKANDLDAEIRCLINIALTDEQLDMQDSALVRLLYARKLAIQYANPELLSMTANYLGMYYLNNKDFENSIKWLEKAIELANNHNLLNEQFAANHGLGLYWLERDNYLVSIKYLEQAYNNAKQIGNILFLKEVTETMKECYKGLNEYEKALAYAEESNLLKDSIFDEEKQNQIRNIEGKLNFQMKEVKIKSQKQIIAQQAKILEQEKRNKIYIIVVAFLILILIFIVYNREQIRRQKERAKLIYEKKLLQTEMEKRELIKKELETELEYKSRQMTTHTLNMMQKNKMLKEITVDITNISKKVDDDTKQNLKQLKFKLNQSLKVDNDWDEFRLYFEQVNDNFFNKLKEIAPNISPADERLAALIKLKLNIKETASVLNISPSSVKMARHRLRQKLNMPPEIDLYDFIGNI